MLSFGLTQTAGELLPLERGGSPLPVPAAHPGDPTMGSSAPAAPLGRAAQDFPRARPPRAGRARPGPNPRRKAGPDRYAGPVATEPAKHDRGRALGLQTTRGSLLSRVRDPADQAAWRDFEARYRELLIRFCRARGLQHADAEDLVQVVFTNLSRSLPAFRYDPAKGRFRDYLFRCARNAISEWAARPKIAGGALDPLVERVAADEPSPAEAADWEREWVAHHYRLAMETVRRTFEARSVEIFDRSVAGEGVASLAASFGMSEQAVHKVRQRIKARMEDLIAEQIREEESIDG